jgi:hypothetical protein
MVLALPLIDATRAACLPLPWRCALCWRWRPCWLGAGLTPDRCHPCGLPVARLPMQAHPLTLRGWLDCLEGDKQETTRYATRGFFNVFSMINSVGTTPASAGPPGSMLLVWT